MITTQVNLPKTEAEGLQRRMDARQRERGKYSYFFKFDQTPYYGVSERLSPDMSLSSMACVLPDEFADD